MIKCSYCKFEKHPDDFYVNRALKSGRTSRCKACINSITDKEGIAAARRLRLLMDEEYRKRLNIYKRNLKKNNPEWYLIDKAKQRSKKHGIPFSLSINDIKVPEFCPIFNIRLTLLDGGPSKFNTATIDRIRPALGYIPGNVWVISNKANSFKGRYSIEDLRMIATNILEHLKIQEG